MRDPEEHASAVIRCSSCGGSRAPNATSCAYCNAAFTVREHDLTGMCGACGARASSNDKFCVRCGEPVVDSEHAARPGPKDCPVCPDKQPLRHRALNNAALLDCGRCGGLWVDRATFARLAAEARRHALEQGSQLVHKIPTTVRPQNGPAYRKCIECGTVMTRKNYGRKSGVIVDVCTTHGIWFDMQEMEEVLGWLRAGGVEAPERVPKSMDSAALAALAVAVAPQPPSEAATWGFFDGLELVGDVIEFLTDLWPD